MEDCAHFESSFGAELNLWHFRTITMSKLKRDYCLWWLREFLITRGYLNYQKNSKERASAFKNRTTPKEAVTRQMSWESRKLGSDLDRNRVMSDDSDSTCQRHATELPDKGQVYKRVRASARSFGLRESFNSVPFLGDSCEK